MKKIILLPIVVLMFCLVGCGGGGGGGGTSSTPSQQTQGGHLAFTYSDATIPQNATNQPTSGLSITLTFSNSVDAARALRDINAYTSNTVISLKNKTHDDPVTGYYIPINVKVNGPTVIVTPQNALYPADQYTLTITKDLLDIYGQSLQLPTNGDLPLKFTTSPTPTNATGSSTSGSSNTSSGGNSSTGSTSSGSGSNGGGSTAGGGGGSNGGGGGSGSGNTSCGSTGTIGEIVVGFHESSDDPNLNISTISYSYGTASQSFKDPGKYNIVENQQLTYQQVSPAIPQGQIFPDTVFTFPVDGTFQCGTKYYLDVKACTYVPPGTMPNSNIDCQPQQIDNEGSFVAQ